MLTVDVAKATGLAFFGVVEAAGPIHSDVAFLSIQSGCSFHASTSADTTELEETIKDRTVIAHVEAALLFGMVLHVVWGYLLEKIDIFVGVKLGHFVIGRRFGTLMRS